MARIRGKELGNCVSENNKRFIVFEYEDRS